MRSAAFQQNVGFETGEPAGCIEHPADNKGRILQEQRMVRKVGDLDLPVFAQWGRQPTCRENFDRSQWQASEASIVRLNGMARPKTPRPISSR